MDQALSRYVPCQVKAARRRYRVWVEEADLSEEELGTLLELQQSARLAPPLPSTCPECFLEVAAPSLLAHRVALHHTALLSSLYPKDPRKNLFCSRCPGRPRSLLTYPKLLEHMVARHPILPTTLPGEQEELASTWRSPAACHHCGLAIATTAPQQQFTSHLATHHAEELATFLAADSSCLVCHRRFASRAAAREHVGVDHALVLLLEERLEKRKEERLETWETPERRSKFLTTSTPKSAAKIMVMAKDTSVAKAMLKVKATPKDKVPKVAYSKDTLKATPKRKPSLVASLGTQSPSFTAGSFPTPKGRIAAPVPKARREVAIKEGERRSIRLANTPRRSYREIMEEEWEEVVVEEKVAARVGRKRKADQQVEGGEKTSKVEVGEQRRKVEVGEKMR